MHKTQTRYCLKLSDKVLPPAMGGKAASLRELSVSGIPIPETLVIAPDAFEAYCHSVKNKLRNAGLDVSRNPTQISSICQSFCSHLPSSGIPEYIWNPICLKIASTFGNHTLIMRSSALGEDSEAHSFAGQLDSIVCQSSETDRMIALHKCWTSFWNPRVIQYQINRNVILGGMSVVVQPFIEARISGVLFTQMPVSVQSDRPEKPMMLECCFGAGEKLVSGKITPAQFLLYPDGTFVPFRSAVNNESIQQILTPVASSLLTIARKRIQQTGSHQDIEWLVTSENRLIIVQSRPVTHISTEGKTDVVWSNVNVNENFPEPLTPVLMSFAQKGYYHYFKNLCSMLGTPPSVKNRLEKSYKSIIDFHHSRMYYNLTGIYHCLNAFPIPSLARKYWDDFIGVHDPSDTPPPVHLLPESKTGLIIYSLRIMFFSFFRLLSLPFAIRRFEHNIATHIKRCDASNRPDTHERHLIDLHDFISIRFNKWRDASLCDALALFGYGFLRSAISHYTRSDKQPVHFLLSGIDNLVTHQSQQHLWNIAQSIKENPVWTELFNNEPDEIHRLLSIDNHYAKLNILITSYRINWGFRISGELLLTRPDFNEAPEKLYSLIKGYIQQDSISPEKQLSQQREKRRKVTREILGAIQNNNHLLRSVTAASVIRICLFLAHLGIRFRERARLKQARLYNRCRHTLRALGRILVQEKYIDHQDDIFFLRIEEQLSLSAGILPDLLNAVINSRKNKLNRDTHQQLPDTFVLPEGIHYQSEDTQTSKMPHDLISQSSVLSGVSACEGKVHGAVRILDDIAFIHLLQKGDILVTTQTDPGWAPVFPLISGLILERGGMLSHGAIVAREYGIPAIVGVKGATKNLTNGQKILLDADSGTIHHGNDHLV